MAVIVYMCKIIIMRVWDTRNRIFDLLLSCADNFSAVRHVHFIVENLTRESERVSVKNSSTSRPRRPASAVTDHPGQRYGFTSLNFAITALRTERNVIQGLKSTLNNWSH